jgi:hypothetical protein
VVPAVHPALDLVAVAAVVVVAVAIAALCLSEALRQQLHRRLHLEARHLPLAAALEISLGVRC